MSDCARNIGKPACAAILAFCLLGLAPVMQRLFGAGFSAGLLPVLDLSPLALGPLRLCLDSLSALFLLPFLLVTGLSALHGNRLPFPVRHTACSGRQWAAFCGLTLSAALVFAAGDIPLFLLGCEGVVLTTLLYGLRPSRRVLCAAHIPVFFIAACALCFAAGGSRHLVFLLALMGFGSLAGLFSVLPLPASLRPLAASVPALADGGGQGLALAATAMSGCGLYGFFRCLALLGPGPIWWGWLAFVLGAAAMLGASCQVYARRRGSHRENTGADGMNGDLKIVDYAASAAAGAVFMLSGCGLICAHSSPDMAALAHIGALMPAVGLGPALALASLGRVFAERAAACGYGSGGQGARHEDGQDLNPLVLTAVCVGTGLLSLAYLPPLHQFFGLFSGLIAMAAGAGASLHSGSLEGVFSALLLWCGLCAVMLAVPCLAIGLSGFFRGFFLSPGVVQAEEAHPSAPSASSGQAALMALAALCFAGSIWAPELGVLCGDALADLVFPPVSPGFIPAPLGVPLSLPDLAGVDRLAGLNVHTRDAFYLLYMAAKIVLLLVMLGVMLVLLRLRYVNGVGKS